MLPVLDAHHFHAGSRQPLGGWEDVAVAGGDHPFFRLHVVEEHIVDPQGQGLVYAHARGGVGLWVEVA